MFLGVLDPDPDPLVKGTDLDPSLVKQNSKKNLDSYCFVTSLRLFIWTVVSPKCNKQKNLVIFWRLEVQ